MVTKRKTVFVGLSGGVDSSVAALRLKNQDYNVVGVFIKVWHPDWLACDWEAERLDAMRVAARLKIPFLTCDAEAAYERDVAQYFIREYEAGRTPNPDVMCNKYVKFGRFLEFAKEQGADFIATGHYAQVQQIENQYELQRGIDTEKDQSYFLWTLTQAELKRVLLPIGDSEKAVVRKEAKAAGLLTAQKPDSQGICFLGHIDIPTFLSHYIDLLPGPVLDTNGAVVGSHQGALVYTNGQRHGFTISAPEHASKPHYVVDRDINTNTITVDVAPIATAVDSLITLDNLNLISGPIETLEEITIQTRYRQTPQPAQVTRIENETLTLKTLTEAESISPGQSCVLYQGAQCLGGGIIT